MQHWNAAGKKTKPRPMTYRNERRNDRNLSTVNRHDLQRLKDEVAALRVVAQAVLGMARATRARHLGDGCYEWIEENVDLGLLIPKAQAWFVEFSDERS